MKKMKFLLMFLFCVGSLFSTKSVQAQVIDRTEQGVTIDSSKVKATVKMQELDLLLIFDCLSEGSSNDPQLLSFASQIAKGMDTVRNPTKLITVTVEAGFIKTVYVTMGVQQERFASGVNDDIKNALLPQIMNHTWLIRELQGVIAVNGSLKDQRIQRAFKNLKAMK